LQPTSPIPAGTYRIGHEGDPISSPVHTVKLNAFHITLTTVGNAQFATFIAHGSYHKAAYWTDMGWRWLQSKNLTKPAFWQDYQFNHDRQPVVGISWYEAVAYCAWLRAETGDPWRLPTEVEWEAAAQHQNPHPLQKINTTHSGIRRTWDILGRGQVSDWGAVDMLGNVWEWTSSRWGRNWQTLDYRYPYQVDDDREDISGSHARVMRGGSWFDAPDMATVHQRGRFLPGSRASNIGFRLALGDK